MERVTVERLLACLDRAPTDLRTGIPDWTYTFEGVAWYVEVTIASPYAAQLGQAYAKRLKESPSSWTTPSTSDGTFYGLDYETDALIQEDALAESIRDSIVRKGGMRYGQESRTHLLIDASGKRVDGVRAAARIAASCPLPADYPPYAGVFVVFAIEDWQRLLVQLKRARGSVAPEI